MTDVSSNTPAIVFALTLDGAGGARPLAEEALTTTVPAWIHLDYSAGEARNTLRSLGLPGQVIDTLTRLESRPRSVAIKDGLMVVLRGINRNAGADPEDMVSLRIWLDQGRLISVRQRPVVAAQQLRKTLEGGGHGPTDPGGLLCALIQGLADGIALFVDDTEARMERLEGQVDELPRGELRSKITELRRQVATVRRYLAPERDALESLVRIAGSHFDDQDVYALREQSDRITRYVEDLDLVRERAQVTQEELMNRIAQEQNTRTYIFTVVATVFLPITFISGVFGMNTAGLPGLENAVAFWWVAGAMAVVAGGLTVWLWLKKWF